tara:strand:- start:488 stop:664 length:177 start_codon:yes stop_codon:yes gene_type:complete
MEYIIFQKDKRPAGDWIISAESEEYGLFHGYFDSEPTAEEVNEIAIKKYLDSKESQEE